MLAAGIRLGGIIEAISPGMTGSNRGLSPSAPSAESEAPGQCPARIALATSGNDVPKTAASGTATKQLNMINARNVTTDDDCMRKSLRVIFTRVSWPSGTKLSGYCHQRCHDTEQYGSRAMAISASIASFRHSQSVPASLKRRVGASAHAR